MHLQYLDQLMSQMVQPVFNLLALEDLDAIFKIQFSFALLIFIFRFCQ